MTNFPYYDILKPRKACIMGRLIERRYCMKAFSKFMLVAVLVLSLAATAVACSDNNTDPEDSNTESVETQPDDDQTPGDDEQTPGDDEQTPGDDEQTPGDDEQTPGDDEQTPGDDEQTPGDGDQTPGDDNQGLQNGQGNTEAGWSEIFG